MLFLTQHKTTRLWMKSHMMMAKQKAGTSVGTSKSSINSWTMPPTASPKLLTWKHLSPHLNQVLYHLTPPLSPPHSFSLLTLFFLSMRLLFPLPEPFRHILARILNLIANLLLNLAIPLIFHCIQLATLNCALSHPFTFSDSASEQYHTLHGIMRSTEWYSEFSPQCQGTTLVKGSPGGQLTLLFLYRWTHMGLLPCPASAQASISHLFSLVTPPPPKDLLPPSWSHTHTHMQAIPQFPASPSPAPFLIHRHHWSQKKEVLLHQSKRNPSISSRIGDLGSPYCNYSLCIIDPSCLLCLLSLTVSMVPSFPQIKDSLKHCPSVTGNLTNT